MYGLLNGPMAGAEARGARCLEGSRGTEPAWNECYYFLLESQSDGYKETQNDHMEIHKNYMEAQNNNKDTKTTTERRQTIFKKCEMTIKTHKMTA